MRKNILICLERLGIGGVETAVVNQAIELKKEGFNVFVIALKGGYSEVLEKKGITCIECEFQLENRFDNEKIRNIIKILKEKDIGQVHIHQFPCILQLWYACALLKIPYVTYLHSGTKQIYEWYEANFNIYKDLFQVFFENAHKIIAVSKMGKESNKEYYGLEEGKYIVLNNSIDFEEFSTTNEVKEIKKFLIIARIAPEKIRSIKNAIELFMKYKDKINDNNLILDIYGEGSETEKLQEYINIINKEKKYNINLCGATNNVKSVIENHDVVMAVGRCILETIALKRIAVVSGNSGDEPLKFIVKENNIQEGIEQNFSGTLLKKEELDKIINELQELNYEKIKEITTKNYNVIYKKLNIKDNVYYISNEEIDNTNYEEILYAIFEKQNNNIEEIKCNIKELEENNNKLIIEINKKEQEQNKIVEENEALRKEINNIYNSKRWKYTNKIAKIFNKKG